MRESQVRFTRLENYSCLVSGRDAQAIVLGTYVDVAVGTEVVPKDRAKQSEPRDVMSSAERRQRVTID